jgi:hypothetical protein
LYGIAALAVAAAPTPEELAGEARFCRDRGREVLGEYDNLVAAYSTYGDYTRDDLRLAKPTYDGVAKLWQRAGEAYEKADADGARALREQAEHGARDCAPWRERMDARLREHEAAPQEGIYYNEHANTAPAAQGALSALIDARRDAADAWCKLAEAMTPGGDPGRIADLREAALRATDEVEVLTGSYHAVNRRERLVRDHAKVAPTTQITEALEKLRRLDDERAGEKREQMAHGRRVRELDRQTAQLEEQLRKAYDAAAKTQASSQTNGRDKK